MAGAMIADGSDTNSGLADLLPRFSIWPMQEVVTIVNDRLQNVGKTMCWGLIPPWAKDMSIGNKIIDASISC